MQKKRSFFPEKTGFNVPLGELEALVMKKIWEKERDGALVSALLEELKPESEIALTTLLTTLDRLFKKGILQREKEGKAYRYRAKISQQELEDRIVNGALNNLISRFPRAVATYLAEAQIDDPQLDKLSERVEELKRRNREGGD
jgi:predicted transcriptional regulator